MDTNNLLVIRGLAGNDPVTLTALQNTIVPHVPDIIAFWWTLWGFMLANMVLRHLVIPLLRKARG